MQRDTQRTGSPHGPLRLAIAAGAVTVAFAGWLVLEVGGPWTTTAVDDLGELAAALVAGIACVRRASREPVRGRRSWQLLAASAFAWAAGEAVWSFEELVRGREVPFPSLADVGFLAAVPLAVAALLSFPGGPVDAAGRFRALLDGLLVGCSILLVSWAHVLAPIYEGTDAGVFATALSLAYPLGDIVVVTIVVVVALRPSAAGSRRPLALVGSGLLALAVADTAFAYLTEAGEFGNGNVLDTGWVAGFLLIALGAAWPATPPSQAGAAPRVAKRTVLLPYASVLVAFAITVLESVHGHLDPFLVVNGFALFGLLAARQFLVLLENLSLNRDLEAKVEARTAEVRDRDARFAALVRRSSDLVSIVTPDSVVQYQSPSIERVLGWSPDEVVGSRFTRLIHPADLPRWRAALAEAAGPRGSASLEWRVRHRDGSWRHLETTVSNLLDEPGVVGIVLNARDVTERKALEHQLRHNAFHDPLTGLANRALFRDRLEHALSVSDRHRRTVAVLFLDLDDFKAVNDGRGHGTGDDLLVAFAARLRHAVRASDTIARMGGDEFAILLEYGDSEAEAVRAAERVLDALRTPFALGRGEVATQASIGIATGIGAEDAEDLMRNADVAMYVAKTTGKGRYEVFRPEMHSSVVERLRLEADLRSAIDREELTVHYQPIVDLDTGQAVAVEALARWSHPERGDVPPSVFIPVAETTGLIGRLGVWLLRRACADASPWRTTDGAPVALSVNLSVRQLTEEGLVAEVRDALEATSFDPDRLTLEITESVLLDYADPVIERLQALKGLGVRLAIDDFGTGYSSLGYLQRLPVDELKIDRSFVTGLPSDPEHAAIVRTILSLAEQFHLRTVAEGVEAPEELDELRAMGCTRAQGFHMARPMPASEVAAALTAVTTTRPTEAARSSSG